MTARLLVVVKEAFPARGSGVELQPTVTADRVPPAPFDVTVRLPDGSERPAKGTVLLAHSRGPLPPLAMIRLAGVSVDAVPPGSELWVDD